MSFLGGKGSKRILKGNLFEKVEDALENFILFGAQIDDTVGDNNIKASGLQIQLIQLFDVSLQKFNVGFLITEFFCVVVNVPVSNGQLFICKGRVRKKWMGGGLNMDP